jgi:cell division transport system ATP-binding protein
VILEGVSLKLHEAEFCYLVGKTGSGKTSFIRTLYGENKLSSGEVNILDHKLSELKKRDIPVLRRKLGMVFQSFQLFSEWTVARNLAYVLSVTEWKDKDKIRNRIEDVLGQVDLLSKINDKVYHLSGGEKQRVAIARALLNQPKIILADEPTGNLDAETSDDILFLLRDVAMANGTSIILATHDQRVLEKFPARTLSFQEGTVIER